MSLLRPARVEARGITADSFGWSSDYESWDAQSVLTVVPAYASVKIISETLSTLPLDQATQRTDGTKSPVPLAPAIASPAGTTTIGWMQRLAVSLLTNHGAVGLLSEGGAGWPTSCTWVNPARLTGEMQGGLPRYKLDGVDIPPERLLYIPSMEVPGKALGLSPVQYFRDTFGAAREAQRANRDWSENRAVPGVTLQETNKEIDPVTAEAISDRASDRIRNGKPFVYGNNWKFDVIQMPAGDIAFLDSIKANATQIAAIYNMPPEMIGGETGNSLTYSTVEQNTLKFLQFTVRPWVVKIEEALSLRLMPRPQRLKFNMDALIRSDTKTRYDVYRIMREIGIRNNDELRDLDDLPPLPDGQGQSYAPLALIQKGGASNA